MSEKQTCCPKCHTIYKVTLSQLTVAQGQVCCPKCALTFNALAHLVIPKNVPLHTHTLSTLKYVSLSTSALSDPKSYALSIFDQRVKNSNINLLTYLNNLSYFKSNNLTNLPRLNLAAQQDQPNKTTRPYLKKHSLRYYLIWGFIDFYLLCIFIFQILWFNPNLVQKIPLIEKAFHHVCNAFNYKITGNRYTLLNIGNVKIKGIEPGKTQFSGFLVNYQNKSLQLPLLKLTLKHKQQQNSMLLQPKDYLHRDLIGIQRIPQNLPYQFKFVVNRSRESIDHYSLEIIYP